MIPSASIKNTLANDEQIKKCFSFGRRHLYIRLAFSGLKWLLIAAGLAFVIFLLYRFGDLAAQKSFLSVFDSGSASAVAGSFFSGFWIRFSLIGLLIFLAAFLPFILFYHLYYLKTANTYIFTDRRIIVKRGWLNTNIKSVNYDRITDVMVDQSFLDKIIYHSGTLSVSTAGSDGYEIILAAVDHPHELKKMLYDLKEEYRKKYYPPSAPPPAGEEGHQN